MIARRFAAIAACAAAATLAACAPSRPPAPAASFAGTISYRERIALPPTARVEIQLVDVNDPDAEQLLAEKLLDQPGQVPIAFSIGYDPHAVDPNHTYALRVRVRVGEELWFASPFDLRVLTAGNPTRANVVLDRISTDGPLGRGQRKVEDPDPPGLDARVRAVREEARAIDARLDRFDMREISEGPTQLRLWVDGDAPVKLEVADSGPITRPQSYYFRDGRLFWMRAPTGGWAFESEQLVLHTDGKLVPQADLGSGNGVLNELASRLALFGL